MSDSRGAVDGSGPEPAHTRYWTRRSLLSAAAAGLGVGSLGIHMAGSGSEAPAAVTTRGKAEANPDSLVDSSDTAVEGGGPQSPILGANLNGRPHRLGDKFHLLEASNTSYVRAFLDVRHKLSSDVPPERDPDVLALRTAAQEWDCKLIVSLKWDFSASWGDKTPIAVPPAGSPTDRALCRCATAYLDGIGAPIDTVVLGNEPMWETRPEDIKVADPPIVRFTRTLTDYLVENGTHGDPTYLVGAFNRVHDDGIRDEQFSEFFRNMYSMVRNDEAVDGVDLHVHYASFDTAEKSVAVARQALPDAVLTATEFSPIWRYNRYTDTPIDASSAGKAFAETYDLPEGMTAVEYFEDAKREPRSPEELAAFYEAMPWYNGNHLEAIYDLFSAYDVRVGTFGFLQDRGMRHEDWRQHWLPFHINFLFQPALMRADAGLEHTAHPLYIDDYRERAR